MNSGMALKSFGPSTLRDLSIKLSYFLQDPEIIGIFMTLPLDIELSVMSPRLGTKPDTDFQMYITLYLSNRLCMLESFIFFNLSQ